MNTEFLTEDDFWDDIHGDFGIGGCLSVEETRLSQNVPIVVSYELVDLEKTLYHFRQSFTLRDTQEYFRIMKDISSCSINALISESDHSLHFYRTKVDKRISSLLKQLDPSCHPSEESTIIFHFALYTDKEKASRATGRRSPRIYFMLGRYGMIYPLFFDPYHEILDSTF